MAVSLRGITADNYAAVCDMDVADHQQDYVACNMWSLVESHYNEGYTCRAIYQDETPVGFIMWVQENENKVSIWRFMIDQYQQGKGIGRLALQLALAEIKDSPWLEIIEICYNPNNPVAGDFYASFGFVEVGMDDYGDDMLAVIRL